MNHFIERGESLAKQVMADLYGCDAGLLNDEERIRAIAKKAVATVGAEIVEECVRKFDPIGITYFAIISTSHFSVHTWPEYGYAAVDVFSCSEIVTEELTKTLKEEFGTTELKMTMTEREVGCRCSGSELS